MMPGITRYSPFWFAFVPLLLFLWLSAQPVYAASITLDSSCILADAIAAANRDTSQGGCPAGNGMDTITLTRDIILKGELPAITSAITIEGGLHAINGINHHRIFLVESSGNLHLNELKLMRGSANKESSVCFVESDGIEYRDRGGAICNDGGTVTLSNCQLIANRAKYGGGIENNGGDLTIIDSVFESNYSERHGGAVHNFAGSVNINDSSFNVNHSGTSGGAILNFAGIVNITGGTFDRNDAQSFGGAINNDGGDVDISRSHFIENITSRGGAIYNAGGIVIITDTVFDRNHATFVAGAIDNIAGSIFITDSTIKNNRATDQDSGAAIFNVYLLEIADTIFEGNEPLDIHASRDSIIKIRSQYSFTCETCEHKIIELPARSN
ncbi:MAG: hypothetical protein OXT68_01130 [Chloroflexota bacterium]|nr:hypothetical protein [Chloroflexota bacterium]MDE2949342.1 hypothetical protein [Chloroflexota bacterium]